MFIAGDTIDNVFPLKDGSIILHDTEKGYRLYDVPKPECQITGAQWKEVAEAVMRIKEKK